MKSLITFLLSVTLLSGCNFLRIDFVPEKMTTYRVKKGQHDFVPNSSPVGRRPATLVGAATLHSNCWYNSLGSDNADWNKLVGIYRFADYNKTKNSFILAWRPLLTIPGHFELTLYENIDGGNFPAKVEPIVVKANVEFRFVMVLRDGKYTLSINDEIVATQANPITYSGAGALGGIGPVDGWFGGNRTAPHSMSYSLWKQYVD